ncbi:PAS domain-containing sensor histidine kinase [Sulfitobacter sp. F26204]|uniref:PAS domain-containing sensor histidine kinase n=1 Tax=Sulfitobacter sp. F26204 TaxID=2996014 RepID=UPI00225DD4E0|nr:PAS domain-containing sensor histidine kinase [Sulfitobacter sp. F26204]MCX7560207.1 PAS domain-containing sensor histidine kinase [Sulfitobacter sp. F26204]
MQATTHKNRKALCVAGACGLATGWYAASSMLLTGLAASVIPAAGAIAIAGVLPTMLAKGRNSKENDHKLLTMSQRLEALNHHAGINIVNENNALTEVNDHLLTLTGYSREELIGQPVKVLYDDNAKDVADEVRSFLVQGKTWQGETQLRRKDGSILFTQSTIMPLFKANGEWAGSISARTDVTEANKLLSERDTAQTLNELRDDIWIVDSETEQFSYMNRAAKGRLSIESDEYKLKGLADFNQDKEIQEVLRACRALRKNGETNTQYRSSLIGVPMHVSINFLPGSNGEGRYLILFNDITDHLQQEQIKSAFISNVSHELRSPLTSIKGAMGLLLSGSAGEIPDKAMTLLDIAHRNADRLILIINDILDLDKISNGQLEFDVQMVDLAELVREADNANAMLQQRFGVSTKLQGLEDAMMVQTDPNRFIQVLTNLLSNAYKFSSPGSEITISVQNEDDYLRIAVKDQGTGIPVNEQHKIFDRFADMTNSDRMTKGGSGLGLNICKAIVESLGGKIGFDTEVGVGTTFYFNLPKTLPDTVAVEEDTVRQIA